MPSYFGETTALDWETGFSDTTERPKTALFSELLFLS